MAMYRPAVRIILKLFELFGCISCVITKQLTDQEARRIALRNQKFSREWSLLNNVTWSREGNAFANVTYGGYTLITGLLLISRCINSKSGPSLTDRIFLIIGVLFFFGIGSLVYASIEQVPSELFDNAIILGSLSYFVGLLFLIDLGDQSQRFTSTQTQTEQLKNNQTSTQTGTTGNGSGTSVTSGLRTTEFKQLNIPLTENDINNIAADGRQSTGSEMATLHEIPANGYYFAGERVDTVHTSELPKSQQPIITKIKYGEKYYVGQPIKTKVKKISRKPDRNIEFDEYSVRHVPQSTMSSYRNVTDTRSDGFSTYSKHDFHTTTSEDDNFDRPIRPGFVAQAARMWDRRARRGSFHEKSTIV